MSATLTTISPDAEGAAIEQALIAGDLAALTTNQRVAYYRRVCESLGLNELTKPFGYIVLNGKLTLYALKGATDQLRSLQGVSITKVTAEVMGDVYVVTAHARTPDGREDQDIGAVNLKGVAGESLANAYMRAITKAKRRVTLSICGLGWLDETEIDAIPGARTEPPATATTKTVALDEHDQLVQIARTEMTAAAKVSPTLWSPKGTRGFIQRAFGHTVANMADLSNEELTVLIDIWQGKRFFDHETGEEIPDDIGGPLDPIIVEPAFTDEVDAMNEGAEDARAATVNW